MTTDQTIKLIHEILKQNGGNFAVLRCISRFDNVNFGKIQKVFNARIDSYSQSDKIVIEVIKA